MLLFVPSAWYHQVENLEDTISINHNWLTAHSAGWALVRLTQVLADIKAGLGADGDDAARVLANAPDPIDSFFAVPKVVE